MTSITTWERFAEATLDHQPEASPMGRELAAQTPPVKLARKARHRKPNRRPMLPLWAGALLLAFDALREQEAATRAQLAELAQGGTL